MSDFNYGPGKAASIANGEDTSTEVDLGAVYQHVLWDVDTANAANLAVSSENACEVAAEAGGEFSVARYGQESTPGIATPADGPIHGMFTNVYGRYVRILSDDTTDGLVNFTLRGVNKVEAVEATSQRKTIA